MIDGNTAALSAYMERIDRDAERAERKQAWRKKRLSELECGMDVEALAATMDENDPAEWHLEIASIGVTPDADRKLLKLDEVMRRLIAMTIEREAEQWRDV